MKLLYETCLSSNNKLTLEESEQGNEKHYYITGKMLQSEEKNRNGRIYPRAIMEQEVDRYIKEQVDQHLAMGELGHPVGEGATSINFSQVSHIMEKMWQEGNDFYGRARLLDTPCGKIAQEILKAGGVLGVSSRALGSVKMNSDGAAVVQEDLHLICVDLVHQPSAQGAYMESIYESEDEYEFNSSTGEYIKVDPRVICREHLRHRTEAQLTEFKQFLQKIRG